MLKRAALLLGLLLAGCPGENPAGPDASVRRDAGRPDADVVVVGEDASTNPTDGGSQGDGGTAGIGWCTLQFPPSATIAVGSKVTIFGQVYVQGETEQAGAKASIEGQVGYGAQGSDGSKEASWTWANATFNKDDANNDEYQADLSPAVGTYSYAYRFRYRGGAWSYCDLTGSGDGYAVANQGALAVTVVTPPSISWCKIVSAASATVKAGQNALVYGQVLATGVTDKAGQGAGVVGEIGFGPVATDPTVSKDWQWSGATFNQDVGSNDEYEGRLSPALPGKYAFAYRFRLGTGDAVYCDTVGGAAFDPAKVGSLEVQELGVDWCNLQFPAKADLTPADPFTAFGQVFLKGVTDQQGAGAEIEGELGVGTTGSDGSTDAAWTWTKAAFNVDDGNNDEYEATLPARAAGAYAYAYRFRYKGGAWTYCDLSGSTNGYSAAEQGALTVAAVKPPTVDWCNVQFPASASVTVGGATTVYGQVFVAGVTDPANQGADVEAQIGYGPATADGSAGNGAAFTWAAATFWKDANANDEYKADLTPAAVGEYAYAYRFRYKQGVWKYCDVDGTTNGFDAAQQGKLSVVATKPPTVDWCELQWPPAATITEGESLPIFGRVFVNGASTAAGASADIEGQVGYGATTADGSAADGAAFTWSAATYNKDVGNNDEYSAPIKPAKGEHAYSFRFRYKQGAWKYCDLGGTDDGYAAANQGSVKVVPLWCRLQWPPDGTISEGTSFTIYGQVYAAGITNPAGAAPGVSAQLGWGAAGTDGSANPADPSWTWKDATFHKDINNNDEHQGELSPKEGNWAYAFRFKNQDAPWTFCDLDGSTNGYDKAQQGLLTVKPGAPWVQMRPLAADVENVGTKVGVSAEIFAKGVTDAAGKGAGITADVGFGPHGVAPTDAQWTWAAAAYLGDADGGGTASNDVYGSSFTAPATNANGYDVAVRFSYGAKTYYADLDGSTDYLAAEAVTLRTYPAPDGTAIDVGWCNVQWPKACKATPNATSCTEDPGTATTSLVYGRVFIAGVTDHVGSDSRVAAQWGVGAVSPSADLFTWTGATWHADDGANNDEYKASFKAPGTAGSYRYVYRFRLSAGTKGWTYCDTDGSNGTVAGFDPAKSGALTVQ